MVRWLWAVVATAVVVPVALGQAWVSLGPAPITNGQTSPTAPVSGAVAHILVDPTSSSTYYAGTVNGGVWKSTNSGTTWTPLTDNIGSTSVGGLAFDPTNSNTLVTGFGRGRSSYYLEGGRIGGFAYSLDGGTNWTTQYTLPANTSVSGVAARSLGASTGTVVVAANDRTTTYSRNGVFLSTNGGTSFTQVSGAAGTGLPSMGVFGLAENATNSAQLFTVPDNTAAGSYSVYRSNDTGSTWAAVGNATMNTQIASADTVKVSAQGDAVVVGIVKGTTVNVWRSGDGGTNWTAWGSNPASNPGSQGLWHFNLLLDPTDPTGNRVYLTGDATQISPYNGRVFRGDFAAGTWTDLFVNGSNAPHADGRSLAINPTTGNLLQGNDGGIFTLSNPSGTFGTWTSLNNTLGTLEFHSAAYDPVSKLAFGGTQDNGTSRQTAAGNSGWNQVLGGDGAQVAVITSPTNPAQSLRYMSSQYLGTFRKGTYDSAGAQVGVLAAPSLTVSGTGSQTIYQYDTSIQFYGPIATNRADGQRLYIGTRRVYESLDQGNNLTVVKDFGAGVAVSVIKADGFSGTTARPEVLYAGTNTGQVWVRKDTGGAMVQLTGYTAGGVADLAVQPTDWRHIVVGSASQVVRSTNVDAATPTFTNITGNLFTANPGFGTLFSVETAHFGTKDVYVAGGRDGVYVTTSDALGTWTEFGTGLPDVVVTDMDYDSINDVLMVATLGRGVWTVPDFSTYFAPVPEPATVLLVAGVALGVGRYARRRWRAG